MKTVALASLLIASALALAGCPRQPSNPDSKTQAEGVSPVAAGKVRLDGADVDVKWSDGDTFRITGGAHAGTTARLAGFNTLEDYGPVHRWGTWSREELHAIAREPEGFLSARGWTCSSSGKRDKYKRLLVDCADVAHALVGEGLAMVFAIDVAPSESLLNAQHAAQRSGKGMWKKGVPPSLVTSVHSVEEGRGYNRIVNTQSGIAHVRAHQERYGVCEEVCEGGDPIPACMLYVPFERRYTNKPHCLR